MRDFLLSWLCPPFTEGPVDKPFIRNKMAQLIALVFVQDYPRRVRRGVGRGRGKREQGGEGEIREKELREMVISS